MPTAHVFWKWTKHVCGRIWADDALGSIVGIGQRRWAGAPDSGNRTNEGVLRDMNTRMVEQDKLGESAALESLRKRGMAANGFVEGYEARDAIMQAARVVREMRSEAGLTQAELAARAGMSQPEISRLETGLGKQGPSVETIGRLAQACNRRLVMKVQETKAPSSGPEADAHADAIADVIVTNAP